jgi:hypothetical protein
MMMISREKIIDEIKKIPEQYLLELYQMIKDFEINREIDKQPSLMSKLRKIKISAPEDFSQTAAIHTPGEDGEKIRN